MRSILKTGLFFCIFLLLIGGIYAFQEAPPINNTLPVDLQISKKEAEALVNEGAWEEAITIYKEVQKKCKVLGLEAIAIDLYEELLAITILRDDLEIVDKIAVINQCKKQEEHPNFKGIYYGALAHLFAFYGEVDSLNKYYSTASQIYTQENRFKLAGNLNATLALEFYMLDDLQAAKTFLEQAEQILNEQLKPHHLDLPNIYNVQTLIYGDLGEYDKALKSNLISIKILEEDKLSHALDLAYEYNNLATIYGSLKDYNNSLSYYLKALHLIEGSKDYPKTESASLIYNIAATYSEQNNFKAAKQASLKSLSYLDSSKEENKDVLADYINNYHQLVRCYSHFGDLDSAEFYIQKAEQINKTFPYRISRTYINYAQISLEQKKFINAKEYTLKALSKGLETYGNKSELVSNAYNLLSDIATSQNKNKEALEYVQQALEAISIDFCDPNGLSNPKLDNILYKGELLSTLQRKLVVLKKLYQQETTTVDASAIYASAKLATETLEQMNRGMKDVNSKRFWLNTKVIPLFEAAILTALEIAEKTGDDNYINEAFILSERSKSMLMTDAMQEANASNFGGVPDSLLERLHSLQKSLAEAEKKRFDAHLAKDLETEKVMKEVIFDHKHHLDLLKHKFEKQYPKYYALKYETSVASIADIQNALSEKTTFIEFFEGEDNIYAFSINKESAHVETIKKEADFQITIYSFQRALMNSKAFQNKPGIVYNKFIKESHYFYNKLLKNCVNKQAERLIIVPDGLLGYLPFEVLLTHPITALKQGTDKGADFSTLPYLIRDYKISYNYSGSLLIAQQASQKNIINGNILALAPSYAAKKTPEWRGKREVELRQNLIELHGAEKEVARLEELYNGSFHIGEQANEATFKNCAHKHGILHLAMHGLVDKKNPEFSGLAMTEDMSKTEDNFLYAYEIKQLGLQAGLVVLSACETGIGKYQRGEGVVSIGRGFMYAGAPALLMTLWSLNDQSGAVIIEQFYKNLSEGIEKDEAIRQAKLFYLKHYPAEYTHPFMWAAFIQVGDYSSVSINHKSDWEIYLGILLIAILSVFLGIKLRKKDIK
ncbi:CHAT domain-containing protein [Aureispira anguillae]|uniref:CHAT domain-containing protein n=1 Tax=Aureispira anguillae TaxID=2864201 RepID=A0A915YFD2_9BACT|nr:CHAT domain-containing tetratricopeptide repeat protein [Aureispira anguillae]BDS12103.1 CHAT domain-containing protein [Aureispira anguillae]